MYYIILWIFYLIKFIIFDIFSYIFIFKPYCHRYTFFRIENAVIYAGNSHGSSDDIFYKNKYHALFRLKGKQYTGMRNGTTGYEKVINN